MNKVYPNTNEYKPKLGSILFHSRDPKQYYIVYKTGRGEFNLGNLSTGMSYFSETRRTLGELTEDITNKGFMLYEGSLTIETEGA